MGKRNAISYGAMMLGRVSSTAMILSGALGMATSATAQGVAAAEANGTEEIIVTATRRSESIRNIPSSISALSEKSLEQSGAIRASDIVQQIPGLAYTQNSVGQAVLAIRGIQTGATVGNEQAPVAIYYNEVPVLDPFVPWTVPQLKLFDAARVEVLRGPQGTLFGAGALSGAIRIITNKPDPIRFAVATEDTVTSTRGGGIGYSLNAMVNVPLVTDTLALRAVGYYDRTAGWIDNPVLGDKRSNRATVKGGRLALNWRPDSNLDVTLTGSQEVTRPHDANYTPYGAGTDVATNQVRNYNDDDTKIANLTIVYTMPWASLTSSTSYIHRDALSSLDFSGISTLLTGLTTVAPLIDEFTTKNFLHEVRLASTQEHPFKWLVGAFVERYRFNLHETIAQAGVAGLGYPTDFLENTFIRQKMNDEALFGEASYDIATGLTFTAGVRYSHYSIGANRDVAITGTTLFDGPPATLVAPSGKSHAFTPKFSLSYKPNEDVMVYALANKGYRAGQSNLNPLNDPITGLPLPQAYEPDSLWNYEVGTKLALFDRRLRIDLAAYYIDWKDIQLRISAPGSGINYTGNAGTARSKGLEAQIVARPMPPLEVGTTLAVTDAKLKTIVPGVSATIGDRLPGSAPFTAYVYGQYEVPLAGDANLLLRADYSYTGREYSYLNNKNNPAALKYGKFSSVGARATLDLGEYEFALFVQNLANSRGRIAARNLYPPSVEVRQTPRIIGLTFRGKW